MNKRQRKKRWKRWRRDADERSARVADLLGTTLGQVLAPVGLYPFGRWADANRMVHVVSARIMAGQIDLGRETVCETQSWDPDNPEVYPTLTEKDVDCMTCLVRLARPCPP